MQRHSSLGLVGLRWFAIPKCGVVSQLHDEVIILEDLAVLGLHCLANQDLLQFAIRSCNGSLEDFAGRPIDADWIAFLQLHTLASQRSAW